MAKAAARNIAGGTPLSYLDLPEATATAKASDEVPLASDQAAFQRSVQTFSGTASSGGKGNVLTRLLEGAGGDADVRVVLPTGFTPISVARYGNDRMRKSLRDLAWFLRYVGYAVVAGDPSILAVNTRGLRDVLEKACSLAATNVALQEMRAASAGLLKDRPEARRLVIDCFNVLLQELAIPTPSTRQRLGSPINQGLQLPATYALAAETAQRYVMRPRLSGGQKAEIVRAAYRQVFERDIVKAYGQVVCPVEATQVRQGDISMREFIRALGRSHEYRRQFFARFSNSRAVELAFRHFLGRGISSREEFTRYFDIVSSQGLPGCLAKKLFPSCAIWAKRPRRAPAGGPTANCSASVRHLKAPPNTSPSTPPTARPSPTSTPMGVATIRWPSPTARFFLLVRPRWPQGRHPSVTTAAEF